MDNFVHILKDLIKIDSSTKAGANQAIEYCADWLRQRDLPVEVINNEGYQLVVCEIGQGEKTVVLNGHVDVIEGEAEQFEPIIQEGKMYGRGSIDMKAGVAAMMETVDQLQNKPLTSKVMLQLVSDEETGGRYGSKYLADNGYRGDFMICGEPTNLGIAIQSKGVLQLDCLVNGKPAHGSRPWEGSNAITLAVDLYERILSLPFAQETAPPLYDKPSINLAKLNGGTVYNKVPDIFEMALDIRYLPDQSPEEIYEQVKSIMVGEVSIHICNDPVKTTEDDPFVSLLKDSIQRETQLEKINVFGQHGSSDAQFFTKYGMPSIEFGPVGTDWHGENELVYINSIKEYINVMKDFILHIK